MSEFCVIVENDESDWDDKTGEQYHFPSKYRKKLQPGTKVIYYKGKQKSKKFAQQRLTDEPHYFGTAIVKSVIADKASNKNDRYAIIGEYVAFSGAVLAKQNNVYLEQDHIGAKSNYWRDAVREISETTFKTIISCKASEDISTNYWVFACNPRRWDIQSFLETSQLTSTWKIRPSDKEKIKPGQLGIIRVGVDNRNQSQLGGRKKLISGVYALVEVLSLPEFSVDTDDLWSDEKDNKSPCWRVQIRFLSKNLHNPILIDELKSSGKISSELLLGGFQGSSFQIPTTDFKYVMERLKFHPEELIFNATKDDFKNTSVNELQDKFQDAAPEVKERTSRYIERGSIGNQVKKHNEYKCQICEKLGINPYGFKKKSGERYVEAHHVMPVSEGQKGSLAASNIMTLCPNHHRQMHYGAVDVKFTASSFLVTIDGDEIEIPRAVNLEDFDT